MGMQIVVQMMPEEFQRFNLYHMRHDKIQKQQVLVLRGLLVVFCIVMGLFMYRNMCPPGTEGFRLLLGIVLSFGVMGVMAVVSGGMLPRWTERAVRKRIEKQIAAGGLEQFFLPQTVTLEADGIACASEALSNKAAYGSLRGIADDGDLTYVYITAVSAVVIPDRAFATVEEKNAFFAELSKKMSE